MRVIFIFGVLANHATSVVTAYVSSSSTSYVILLASHLILHFTRMGFMFISGLVLFLQYYHKDNVSWPGFWLKRYKGSGIPYVLWNAIYTAFALVLTSSLTFSKWGQDFWGHILHADGFYMYYLLVMFQLYLIFPLLVMMFKKLGSTRNQLILMGISAAVQLAFTFWTKYKYPYISTAGWPYLLSHYGNFIGAYQFYFLAGAFVSINYQTCKDFLQAHAKALYGITAVLAAGTFGLYYFNTKVLGLTRHYAELIHQPYLMIYASFMVATVFLLSLEYAKRRTRPGWQPFAKFVGISSKISFGIYLGQTVALTLLTKLLSYVHTTSWAMLLLTPLAYLFALGFTWIMSYIFYKVPPFGVLIGRPQMVTRRILAKFKQKKEVTVQ